MLRTFLCYRGLPQNPCPSCPRCQAHAASVTLWPVLTAHCRPSKGSSRCHSVILPHTAPASHRGASRNTNNTPKGPPQPTLARFVSQMRVAFGLLALAALAGTAVAVAPHLSTGDLLAYAQVCGPGSPPAVPPSPPLAGGPKTLVVGRKLANPRANMVCPAVRCRWPPRRRSPCGPTSTASSMPPAR